MDWKIGLAVLLVAVLLKGCIGAEFGPAQGEGAVLEGANSTPAGDIGDMGDLDDQPPPPPPG